MSNNRDAVISAALNKLNEKKNNLDFFNPDEKYSFKTNCRYGDSNIKTLRLADLLNIRMELEIWKGGEAMIEKTYPFLKTVYKDYESLLKLFNYTGDEWISDVDYLIRKTAYKDATAFYDSGKSSLEAHFSEDKKSDLAVESLLKSLGIEE